MVLTLRVPWGPERNWQGKQKQASWSGSLGFLTLLKTAYLLFFKLLLLIFYSGTFKSQLRDKPEIFDSYLLSL